MSDASWTDRIVGERMTVDQAFTTAVEDSRFSSQEWSLIMTATEFEIVDPATPERATLRANTDKVEQILPELERIRSQTGAMGAPTNDSAGASSGGLFASLKRSLGFGSERTYDAEREAAERLTQAYADQLQAKLESNGRWESICEIAADDE